MSGYSQMHNKSAREEAYLPVCCAADAADKDERLWEMLYWDAIGDLIESKFRRTIGKEYGDI